MKGEPKFITVTGTDPGQGPIRVRTENIQIITEDYGTTIITLSGNVLVFTSTTFDEIEAMMKGEEHDA